MAKATRNTLKLDTKGFTEMLRKLDSLGGDTRMAVDRMLTTASKRIAEDTEKALDPQYLPAKGHYSSKEHYTEKSIIRDAQVRWQGLTAFVPVGFDFSKPGAGGYLITGTPKMKPDIMLNKMYKQKKYMKQIQEELKDIILSAIVRHMEE